jgi:hypothetical protein
MLVRDHDALRTAFLPSHLLPLLTDRQPFQSLSAEAIDAFLEFSDQFPESVGRLSATLKARSGLDAACPAKFVIFEAHVDLESIDVALEAFLVGLGFEPDHFLSLNPVVYERCYTLKFEIDRTSGDLYSQRRRLRHEILRRFALACQYIAANTTYRAYAEAEVYTDLMKTRILPFKNFDAEGLQESPLLDLKLLQASPAEVKILDIHVKIPLPQKGSEFAQACPIAQENLVEHFLSSGFYEIRSFAGNRVLTLQLVDAKGARRLFHNLSSWAARFGGIGSMNLETCMAFWQQRDIGGQESPIPQVWRLA